MNKSNFYVLCFLIAINLVMLLMANFVLAE
jgi:hypothetical protein